MSGFSADAFAGLGRDDKQILRDYVTGKDHLQYTQLPEGVVQILLTHSNVPTNFPDLRLDLHMTISQVKDKFRTHIGTPGEFQRLILKQHGQVIGEMTDNNKKLGFYSVVSGNEIHVIDTDPYSLSRGGGLTDVSLVEKYRMDEETYNSRKGTMRDYIREQRKKNPNFKLKPAGAPTVMGAKNDSGEKENESANEPPPGIESIEGISVGMRCEVQPGARRGVVKWVGESDVLKAGYWVGVHLDEPLGMNNGTVKGEVLFECPESHGSLCRGKNVSMGDFPEVDPFADLDSDEEEI